MTRKNGPFICIENLTVGYGDRVIIKDASFNINYGDIFVIMGLCGRG